MIAELYEALTGKSEEDKEDTIKQAEAETARGHALAKELSPLFGMENKPENIRQFGRWDFPLPKDEYLRVILDKNSEAGELSIAASLMSQDGGELNHMEVLITPETTAKQVADAIHDVISTKPVELPESLKEALTGKSEDDKQHTDETAKLHVGDKVVYLVRGDGQHGLKWARILRMHAGEHLEGTPWGVRPIFADVRFTADKHRMTVPLRQLSRQMPVDEALAGKTPDDNAATAKKMIKAGDLVRYARPAMAGAHGKIGRVLSTRTDSKGEWFAEVDFVALGKYTNMTRDHLDKVDEALAGKTEDDKEETAQIRYAAYHKPIDDLIKQHEMLRDTERKDHPEFEAAIDYCWDLVLDHPKKDANDKFSATFVVPHALPKEYVMHVIIGKIGYGSWLGHPSRKVGFRYPEYKFDVYLDEEPAKKGCARDNDYSTAPHVVTRLASNSKLYFVVGYEANLRSVGIPMAGAELYKYGSRGIVRIGTYESVEEALAGKSEEDKEATKIERTKVLTKDTEAWIRTLRANGPTRLVPNYGGELFNNFGELRTVFKIGPYVWWAFTNKEDAEWVTIISGSTDDGQLNYSRRIARGVGVTPKESLNSAIRILRMRLRAGHEPEFDDHTGIPVDEALSGKSDEDKGETQRKKEDARGFWKELERRVNMGTVTDMASGIQFDDWTLYLWGDIQDGSKLVWSQVCEHHANEIGILIDNYDTCGAETICGVKDCDMNAEVYYDFDPVKDIEEALAGKSDEDKSATLQHIRKTFPNGARVYYSSINDMDGADKNLIGEFGTIADVYRVPDHDGFYASVRFDKYPGRVDSMIWIGRLKSVDFILGDDIEEALAGKSEEDKEETQHLRDTKYSREKAEMLSRYGLKIGDAVSWDDGRFHIARGRVAGSLGVYPNLWLHIEREGSGRANVRAAIVRKIPESISKDTSRLIKRLF